jgi:hypothetical protein
MRSRTSLNCWKQHNWNKFSKGDIGASYAVAKLAPVGNQWAKAIKQGKKVKAEVKIKYDGDGLRLSSFEINYKLGNEEFKAIIKNI